MIDTINLVVQCLGFLLILRICVHARRIRTLLERKNYDPLMLGPKRTWLEDWL